jgi:hypothetical protein
VDTARVVALLSLPLLLAHCETAAVEMASVIKTMMMAASCAQLLPSSFISFIPPAN